MLILGLFTQAFASVPMPSYQVPLAASIAPDGTLEVIFPEVVNSGCTSGNGIKVFVKEGNSQGVTEKTFPMIQSFVLAAVVAQKPIKFLYDRIDTVCEGGMVTIKH